MTTVTQDDINILVKSYFKQPSILYEHLHSSFHQLVEEIIPYSLCKENNVFYESIVGNIIYSHAFNCSNVRIKPPTNPSNNELLTPKDARKKHLKYFGTIVADVEQVMIKEDMVTGDKTTTVIENEKDVSIGNIPIMVKSKYCTTSIKNDQLGECRYDPGGYFIVNGAEKAVMCIEKMVDNKILIFGKSDPLAPNGRSYIAHINSRQDEWSDNLQIVTIKSKKNGDFVLSNSQFADIPIFIIMRALGLESDMDIITNITYNIEDIEMLNLLRPSIIYSVDELGVPIRTKEEATNYLITKLKRNKRISQTDELLAVVQRKMYLDKILRKDLLPHLGEDIPKKIRFIGLMINNLLRVLLGLRQPDDRDAMDNKRIETPGILIGQLFRQNWKKQLNEVGKHFKRKNQSDEKPNGVANQLRPTTIEQGIKTALATGIWGMNRTKKGVAQSLQRLSWVLAMSNLRRIMAPSLDASTTKVTSIRHINNISYGFICPVQTPEGQKIGIVKSLAMMSSITNQNMSQKVVLETIMSEFKQFKHPFEIDPVNMKDWGKIMFNGDWVGCTKQLVELYKLLIDKRTNSIIDRATSICLDYDEKELNVYYDAGRLIRPLLNIKDNKLVLTKDIVEDAKRMFKEKPNTSWKTLIAKYPSIISYEDIESSKTIMVAADLDYLLENNTKMTNPVDTDDINRYGRNRFVRYTHVEFHRWIILGEVTSGIPFGNHNYATKNIVNFSQRKQGIGLYLTSYKDRMDISQILYHPHTPIVKTEAMSYNNMLNLPDGENVIIAIMSYNGYNQEDSLIFNQSAIDRGLFRVDSLKKYHSEIQKNPSTSQDDIFLRPDKNKVTGMKQGNYDKLNEKGYVVEETEIFDEDIIIGKVSPIQPTGNNNKVYKDTSEIFKSTVPGVIDRVHTNIFNSDGYEQYNVRVRMERVPIIGDKFASLHGQKGTLGIAFQQKDMPFTEDGMVPDLILNPHAIPSRMTIGQLIECITSKIGAIEGKFIDGTPFNNYNIKDIPSILKKLGYEARGTEIMYCGITGKKIESAIFIGPTYYMRLKHMVLDKVHCLTLDHEVLTDNGWKYFKQISKDDKIATLGKDGVEYQHPLDILYYPDYEGTMYKIYNNNIDLDVTSNHRMYVSDNGEDYRLDLIDNLLGKSYYYKRSGENTTVNSNNAINNIVTEFYTNHTLLESTWGLNKIDSLRLIEMIFDGSKMGTSSQYIADSMMRLALQAGLACTLTKVHSYYNLDITSNNNFIVDPDDILEYEHTGPVFCLSVPNEVFYVRRNGKPVWTGNSRARGPKQATTRQPLEGRSRAGGLKVGEMEKDSMGAHGLGQFTKERMMETSDIDTFKICDDCGFLATRVIDKEYYVCSPCNNNTRISSVNLPYACKLLFQELMSINILPRIRTEQSKYD